MSVKASYRVTMDWNKLLAWVIAITMVTSMAIVGVAQILL